jgi:hypothetical protein
MQKPIRHDDCFNATIENAYSIEFHDCNDTDVCDLYDRLQYFLSAIYMQVDKIGMFNTLKLLANRHLPICSDVKLADVIGELPFFESHSVQTLGDFCRLKSWNVEINEAREIYDFFKAGLESLVDSASVVTDAILATAPERDKMILQDKLFVHNKTLEALGLEFCLTKEAIRLISNKIIKKIRRNPYLLGLVSSFQFTLLSTIKCSACFTVSELQRLGATPDFLDFISDVLEDKYYLRIPDTDLIAVCPGSKSVKWVDVIINSALDFPDLLPKSEQLETIASLSDTLKGLGYDIPEAMIANIAFRRYLQSEDYVYRDNLLQADKYLIILDRFFPSGIVLRHKNEIVNFRKAYQVLFADEKIAESDKALFARITAVTTQIDQGMYTTNAKLVDLSKKLSSQLTKYITDNPCDIVSTSAIMNRFSQELNELGITNIYHLSSVLRKRLPEFSYRRNFVIKGTMAITLFSQITLFVEKNPEGISFQRMKARFEGMSDFTIRNILTDCNEVIPITPTMYIHKRFIVFPEHDKVLSFLREIIAKQQIASSYKTYRLMSKFFRSFFAANNITTHYFLFSILRAFFGDEFKFSRPHIMDLSFSSTTHREILKNCFWGKKIVIIADINMYAKKNSLFICDWLRMLDSYNDKYFILNHGNLIAIEELGYINIDFFRVEEIVIEALGDQKYCEISKLDILHKLPKANIELTDWIVYSIINKYGLRLNSLASAYIFKHSVPLVALNSIDVDFVRDEYSASKSPGADTADGGLLDEISDFESAWEETN